MEEITLIIVAIGGMSALIIATIVFAVMYSGLLHRVVVGAGKPQVQNLKVAYKFGRGPYKNTGEIFTEASIFGPEKCRCFGIYYDDPKVVPSNRLRWAVGCILAEGVEDPDSMVVERCRKEGFKFFHIPSVTNVVKTSFPYRSQLSIFVAIFKVYPELSAYIQANKLCAHPFMEIYTSSTIEFLAPLARQDEFYVPEALEEYKSENEEEDPDETGESSLLEQEHGQGDVPRDAKVAEVPAAKPGPSGEGHVKAADAAETERKDIKESPGEATPPVEIPVLCSDHTYAVSDNVQNTAEDKLDEGKSKAEITRAKSEQPKMKNVTNIEPVKDPFQARSKKAASMSRMGAPDKTGKSRMEFIGGKKSGVPGAIQEPVVTSSRHSNIDSGLASECDSISESGLSSRMSASNTTSEASSFSLLTGSANGSSRYNSETSWGSSRLTEFSDSGSDHDIFTPTDELSNASEDLSLSQDTSAGQTSVHGAASQ